VLDEPNRYSCDVGEGAAGYVKIDVRKSLQDAAYVAVGVNVIAFRQARRSLQAVIDGTWDVAQSLNPNREASSLAIGLYYATLGGLVTAEIIDPEIAVIVGVGHLLASSKSPPVHEAGEALQAA
jgi:hypothetical protein